MVNVNISTILKKTKKKHAHFLCPTYCATLAEAPVLYLFPLGHIKQPLLVMSHMHVCFSIRWKCCDVVIECFAAWLHQNVRCLNHNTSIWILLKMQAPLMLCMLYYSHVVEWMYVYVRGKVCWCVWICCCSANERLGVSGADALREEVSDRAHE